jgi:hypothetical protein
MHINLPDRRQTRHENIILLNPHPISPTLPRNPKPLNLTPKPNQLLLKRPLGNTLRRQTQYIRGEPPHLSPSFPLEFRLLVVCGHLSYILGYFFVDEVVLLQHVLGWVEGVDGGLGLWLVLLVEAPVLQAGLQVGVVLSSQGNVPSGRLRFD